MPTAWRQGHLIAPEDAIILGLITPEQRDTHRALVISHSCDIASPEETEPDIELLLAVVITEQQANARNGHGIRKLHVPARGQDGNNEWIELRIAERRSIRKADFLDHEPWDERAIPLRERDILRRWLAQRYSRSEFPDTFVEWLRQSGVGDRFERLGRRYSGALVGIYFDLADDTERDDPSVPYELGIYLIYSTHDTTHAQSAGEAADELQEIFESRCRQDQRWQWIELVYCEAASDEIFSLRAVNELRRWRFEHRSLDGEPIDNNE